MSKKTRYVLGRVAAAVALVTTSSLALAANCSTSYCFVDGKMKISTHQDLESLYDLLAVSISTPSGSTTTNQNGNVGDQGYVTHIFSSPITKVSFSQSIRIGTAWAEGSALAFTRSGYSQIVSMKDMAVKLQSAPTIVSIDSTLQGTRMTTLWNLNGDGTDIIYGGESVTTGNGSISATPEPDGFYHARVTVSIVGLAGSTTYHAPDGALKAFWSSFIRIPNVWYDSIESNPFGSVELDMRFTKP